MEITKNLFVLFYAFIGLYLAIFLSPNKVLIVDVFKKFDISHYLQKIFIIFNTKFKKLNDYFDKKIIKIKFRTLSYEIKVRKINNMKTSNNLILLFSSPIFLYNKAKREPKIQLKMINKMQGYKFYFLKI